MDRIRKFFYYLFNDRRKIKLALLYRFSRLYSDEKFLKKLFKLQMGKELNLDNPQSFSEKLQWLKLYDRRPEYTQMVDKYEVKKYVANIIGEEYIIPTFGVWNSFDEIDFDALPNQFVLKTTHGGGNTGVVICKDKSIFNREHARKRLQRSMKHDIYKHLCEWPYKNVKRRIIAEQYMEDESGYELKDYKFFCFNGELKCCQVIAGRGGRMTVDFFDNGWKHLPFHEPKNYPFSIDPISCPELYQDMVVLATKLSQNHPFLRVDFYYINNRIYFGELTFFPTSGMGGFDPEEWDYTFGSWIELPRVKE